MQPFTNRFGFCGLRRLTVPLLAEFIRSSGLRCRSDNVNSREPDTSATRHFGITKLVPKFKTNHRWSCVSSELSWMEVSRLFLDHGTRVEVSRTTFLASKCLKIGAELSRSV